MSCICFHHSTNAITSLRIQVDLQKICYFKVSLNPSQTLNRQNVLYYLDIVKRIKRNNINTNKR